MTEDDILTAHGFTKAKAYRAMVKHPDKRTDAEQALIVDLVTLRRGRP